MLNKIKLNQLVFIFIGLLVHSATQPIFDNRYLPLFTTRLPRLQDKKSRFFIDMFAMQAKQAYGENDQEVPLPELCGKFNLAKLNNAMNKVGKPNDLFLDPFYYQNDMIWNRDGKISAQGFNFGWEQNFCTYFTPGIQSSLIHCSSRQSFSIEKETIENLAVVVNGVPMGGQRIALNRARGNANTILGIDPAYWDKTSLGDTSFYLRIGKNWNYTLKCRNIDLGFTLGGIYPSAAKRDINNPASIPLGGNGHPGILYKLDAQIELKEDWFVGGWMAFIQRLSKTDCHRMPHDGENIFWGTLVGTAKVNPGLTFGISPFASIEDAANGWGLMARFTFVYHNKDKWTDERNDPVYEADVQALRDCSSWGSEYVSLSLIYDGFRNWGGGATTPRCYFNADIPVGFFEPWGTAKTYKFTLGFELDY